MRMENQILLFGVVANMVSGSFVCSGSVHVCPFDNLSCSGDCCLLICSCCGLLKPKCSRFDVVKFSSKGFPRGDFSNYVEKRKRML
jgi:hypothetical protein